MFIHPSLYLIGMAFCLVIYWLPLKNSVFMRGAFLSVFSLSLIALLMPALLGALLLSCLIAYGYKYVQPKFPSKIAASIAVGLQIGIMWMPDLTDLSGITLGLALVGLAYFTLRNIGVIIDIYKAKVSPSLWDVIFLNSFFPTYSAGPVENLKTFNMSSCDTQFDGEEFLYGLARLFVGILKFYLVSGELLVPFIDGYPSTANAIINADLVTILTALILSWIQLYMAFSGYSDMAIGSSRLFGIKVRENFNFPFLATNIQNFWQRWNISIMNFVSEYFYINFVRVTGWRIFGMFLAFFVMGMWHHVSWNYLIWSFGHGGAMAGYFLFRRSKSAQWLEGFLSERRVAKGLWTMLSWAITITFVAYLSAIATAPDLETGLAYIRTLFQ